MKVIVNLLKKNNLKRTHLAKIIGYDYNTLSRVLSEQRPINKRFCTSFKKGLQELLKAYTSRRQKEIDSLAKDIKAIEDELDKALLK